MLAEGTPPPVPVTARLVTPQIPAGACPKTMEELFKLIGNSTIQFDFTRFIFAATSGTFDSATVDDRLLPRFMFDDQGRFLGLFVWVTELGDWVVGAAIGEIRTLQRSAGTTVEDKNAKGYRSGWYVCDGTNGAPDLTGNTGFFTGTGPEWAIYSVIYLGV